MSSIDPDNSVLEVLDEIRAFSYATNWYARLKILRRLLHFFVVLLKNIVKHYFFV